MTNYGRRAAGTPLTDKELGELQALSQLPDSEIDFSEIPERVRGVSIASTLPLEEHTITLRVDSEVAAWLEKAANEDANRINWILKREAKRNRKVPVPSSSLLDKAS